MGGEYNNLVLEYLNNVQKILDTGDAREHTYRSDFKILIESLVSNIQAINEPAYTGGNAPDFLFKKGDTPIAYAECKDVTVDIKNTDTQKQAKRYADAFGKILLTNYYDFQFIPEEGEKISVSIAVKEENKIVPTEENFDKFVNLIQDYITPSYRTIKSAKRLAEIMASKARIIRDNALASLSENKDSDIFAQYESFKQVLIRDLSENEFADMYAQTLVYGLFVARYYDKTEKDFSRHEAQDLLPSSNPLLKKFFGHVAGTDYDPKIAWLVDSLIETYSSTSVAYIMHKEFEKKQKDPVLHFYETFLTSYDKGLRKKRGVYYTPEPVVSFIVRSVDQILKTKFGLSKGLADTTKIEYKAKVQGEDGRTKDNVKRIIKQTYKVQILDPAVGTGTFLNEVIHEIHKKFVGQEGQWDSYVRDSLLSRLHGFELMMASYTMAHLKLGITLKELGYKGDERLSVWLTNSLEGAIDKIPDLFMGQWLTKESNQASKIKSEMPIMVVLGNPPYSGESSNKNYKGHNVYKVEPGGNQKLQERNSKWLNDDYVKFIRFAENQIEKTGEGIVSFITPHGYLDNPTFRGMRWHLMETFSEIYVLDLHGNANKNETTSEGGKDENVFGIKTGTSIIFAIKNKNSKNKTAKVYHADFYGKQNKKYNLLNENNWESIKWKKLSPNKPNLYFIPFNNELKKEYNEGFSIVDLMETNSVGIVTSRDKFIINNSREKLIIKIKDFLMLDPDKAKQKYNLRENQNWKIIKAQKHIFDEKNLQKISYRPFDNRWIYYHNDFIERSRKETMKHFNNKNNVGLVLCRQVKAGKSYQHNFITNNITESTLVSNKTSEIGYVFPLYSYVNDSIKNYNFNIDIIGEIKNKVGATLVSRSSNNPTLQITDGSIFTPENILDYIYAVLHSPKYREKYKEFLKIDFPRVPYPENKQKFWNLVGLGKELRELHLLESPKVSNFITTFPESGSNKVEKKYPKYEDEKVFINYTQYFGNVPEVAWNFYIGGYQPAQKWLKDRRERELSNEDIDHYQEMIVSLTETHRIMQEIDKV
ncbi:MAG: DNA methyltransferase [Candidatus Magasanikbacteria bacterium]|nr:DNA methyltransferase [Candidatus Magasanikbacteria bacterium]